MTDPKLRDAEGRWLDLEEGIPDYLRERSRENARIQREEDRADEAREDFE